jgi:hypothetical protein
MDDKIPKNCEEKETVMLDGGERTTYEGGAQREPHKGKGRYDWITPFGVERTCLAGIALFGLPEVRVKENEPASSICQASCHINEWREGKRDKDYLAFAAWFVVSAMHFEATGEMMERDGYISLSPYALERLAKWSEKGGEKYNKDGVERNWERGMLYDHPLDSALRHINCWREGKKEEDKLAAVLWNIFALIHYEECGMEKFDNIPKYPEAKWRNKETSKRVPGQDGKFDPGFLRLAIRRDREERENMADAGRDKLVERAWPNQKPLSIWMNGKKIGEAMVDIDFDVDKYIRACEILVSEALVVPKLEDDPRCFAPPFISAEKKFEPMPPKIQKTSFVKEMDAHGKTWEDLDETTYPWTIVEDFDGTLCKGAWPEIGEPNWEEIAYILKRQKEGAKIILATCREDERLDAAVAWCADKGIIFDAVNENLPGHCTRFGGDSRKIYGDEYRDDKAVRVTFGEKARAYDYKALLKPEERDDLTNAKQFLDEMKREDRESDRFMLIWARRIVEAQTATIDRLTEGPK